MSWKDEIIKGLQALGGQSNYQDLYAYIEKHTSMSLTKEWKASVRNAMETFSSDSKNYNGTEDLFYSVGGIGSGVWGLSNVTNITAVISSGKNSGRTLSPHKYPDGKYVVSSSKFEEDYIRVDDLDEVKAFVKAGYKLRMSNLKIIREHAPTLINPEKITIGENSEPELGILEQVLYKLAQKKSLDQNGISINRKEQALLRKLLVGSSSVGVCTLCEKSFPVNILVAAHIKKRSKCSIDEKLDFTKIATLMCKFGCDELYEKGYIYVDQGTLKKNIKMETTLHMDELIKPLEGKDICNWQERSDYYDWHKENVAKLDNSKGA